MPFTATKLDTSAAKRLDEVYGRSVERMIASFDDVTDFSRANRLQLIASINGELKSLSIETRRWIDREIPKAYTAGMRDAINGLSEADGYKVFYHGSGNLNVPAGNNMFGRGFYITDSESVAKQFGNVSTYYLNIFDPNQILRINNQSEYDSFVFKAINKYPGMDAQLAMPKYAKDLGYKAVLGSKDFDELAGINVLDKSLVTRKPLIPVKALFTQPNKLQIQALIDDVSKSFGDSLTLVGRNVQAITTQAFQRQIRARIAEGIISSQTRQDIVAAVREQLRARGLTALTDKSGKSWTLDRYADMLARTKLVEARNSGLATKMLENGQDLVQVSINGSSHYGCAQWEGKVLSISGSTEGFKTVDYAQANGLFHPNCKHTINPINLSLAAKTYGWDRNTGEYRAAVFEEGTSRRLENAKQTYIEELLNRKDYKTAADVIASVNDDGLRTSLQSLMKYYTK